MKKSVSPALINYVYSFMERHCLIGEGRYLLAVSGGADSVFLLRLFHAMLCRQKIKALRVVHVHHGLRKESDGEEEWMRQLCQQLGVELIIHRLRPPKVRSNVEAWAREQRYSLIEHELQAKERLVTAHQLDDSFEWSLMQQSRSSSLNGSLGIPCRRKHIIRPLLCLTRKQIERHLALWGQDFCHDESNELLDFDRNYLRHQVIPSLAQRYPRYLKHYAYRSNALASKLGLLATRAPNYREWRERRATCFFAAMPEDFEQMRSAVKDAIVRLSSGKRGTLEKQLDKLLKMPQGQKSGPLLFSGGVQALVQKNSLFLYRGDFRTSEHKEGELFRGDFAAFVAELWKRMERVELSHYPFWLVVKKSPWRGGPKRRHSLYSDPFFPEEGLWSAFDVLRLWRREKRAHRHVLEIEFLF